MNECIGSAYQGRPEQIDKVSPDPLPPVLANGITGRLTLSIRHCLSVFISVSRVPPEGVRECLDRRQSGAGKSPDDRGPFVGSTRGNEYVYHFFMGIDENSPGHIGLLPADLLRGTMELPPMTINGHRYERQVLTFKRTLFFAFTLVNC